MSVTTSKTSPPPAAGAPSPCRSFLLVQVVAVVFFVGDVIGDLRESPGSTHFIFEAIVTAALARRRLSWRPRAE